MPKKLTAAQKRRKGDAFKAYRNIGIVVALLGIVAFFYYKSILANRSLDAETLCPSQPDSLTVLLVDVTDPMNLPQRQDFLNQLDRLTDQIPRYGKLIIAKVDPVSDRLLVPIITRCNPGSAKDVTEVDGNPQKLEKMHQEQYLAPLRSAFERLTSASGANRSPILESIQSVNLTELQKETNEATGKRLIVASDLLQNTNEISFYGRLPAPHDLLRSQQFSRVRTDLRGVDVELWMLQRSDSTDTQPRALPNLWEKIIDEEGGRLARVYTVSG